MATFIGTEQEFLHFIGPTMRNSIQNLTRKFKDNTGKCMYCGNIKSKTNHLEYAHFKEMGRRDIAKSVLSTFPIKESIREVNIDDFIIKFEQAHMPIEQHGYALCKTCHKKYDNNIITDSEISKPQTNKQINCDKKSSDSTLDILRRVGIETFIKHFDIFKSSAFESSNKELYESFELANEDWKETSKGTKASQGKKIFKENRVAEALDIVINNTIKIDDYLIVKAAKYRKLY